MRGLALLVGVCGAAFLGVCGSASAAPVSFSGSCSFAGPISPMPPITVVPNPGAHFSYAGSGGCRGTLGGHAVDSAPIAVTFTNVSTLFDTCELGPDFGLHGVAMIGAGASRARFAITINLARVALVGPFIVSTSGGGDGIGVAQFQPADAAAAVQQCGAGGVAKASLSGNFQTLSALVGEADPVVGARPRGRRHARHARHRRRRRVRAWSNA